MYPFVIIIISISLYLYIYYSINQSNRIQLLQTGGKHLNPLEPQIESPPLALMGNVKQLNLQALKQLYKFDPHTVPFKSPFDADFFHVKIPQLHLGFVQPPFNHNQHAMDRIFYGLKFNYKSFNNDGEMLESLITGNIDFAIFDEFYLNNLDPDKMDKVGFVGSLYKPVLNMLVSYDIELIDFSDIKYQMQKGVINKLTVNFPSETDNSSLDIFNYLIEAYQIDPNRIKYDYSTGDKLRQRYLDGDIDAVFRLEAHPSRLYQHLTSLKPSKFITFRLTGRYVDESSDDLFQSPGKEGESTIDKAEGDFKTRFFKQHSTLKGTHLDQESLLKFYPRLTFYNYNVLRIPTIETRTNLISRLDVDPGVVYYVTNSIFLMLPLFRQIPYFGYKTALSVAYGKTPINFHPGAKKYYHERDYYTTSENSHCIHYKYGHCPKKKPRIFKQMDRLGTGVA